MWQLYLTTYHFPSLTVCADVRERVLKFVWKRMTRFLSSSRVKLGLRKRVLSEILRWSKLNCSECGICARKTKAGHQASGMCKWSNYTMLMSRDVPRVWYMLLKGRYTKITKSFCVLHTQSKTTIFHLVVQWIILGWISRRWDVGIWTGLGWPRIETGGGPLWVR